MKRITALFLVGVICITTFISCSKTTPQSIFTLDGSTTVKINLTNGSASVSILDSAQIEAIIGAINTGAPVPDSADSQSLPKEQYRLTMISKDEQAINTITVYSDSHIQINTSLYTGSFAQTTALLANHFKITPIDEIFAAFIDENKVIEELAFHHSTNQTYKIISRQEDIQAVLTELKKVTQLTDRSPLAGTEQYRFYVRYQGEAEYTSPLIFSTADDIMTLTCGTLSCCVPLTSFDTLFNQMNYNIMP